MSVEEKDRWWLENVYQGDVRQLTVRVVICGFLLGGLLSVTNLYIGAKTGWTLGNGITSVVLAFVLFKVLNRLGLVKNYHVLENNILQTMASSAGYVIAPLIASMAAYMMVTNQLIDWWKMILWLIGLSLLGVLVAIPFKRRFINDEQLPFPEGRAAGMVLDTLHSTKSDKSVLSARLLIWSGALAIFLKFAQSHKIMEKIQEKIHLTLFSVPERLDEWYYRLAAKYDWWIPNIAGVPIKELTIRPELEITMIGAGGLMGIRTGVSLILGSLVNYCILVPWMIHHGDIEVTREAGAIVGVGYTAIAKWSLWFGVAIMTTASLFTFLANPRSLAAAFKGIWQSGERTEDCLRSIELPIGVTLVGVPIVGAYLIWLANWIFGVEYWLGVIAVPIAFVFALIAVNSTGLTSITPLGPLAKITQFMYSGLAPKNITTNIASAGLTSEVSAQASTLIQNIKPGYMLGAKPRLQAVAHVIGVFSGAIFSVAVFYALFLRDNPAGLVTEDYPYPAAQVWMAVAKVLTQGFDQLPTSAVIAAIVGALLGIVFEVIRSLSRNRFSVSAVGIGLGFMIPFGISFAMFFGSFLFWLPTKIWPKPEQKMNKVLVQNIESICAGLIAGAALIGVGIMALEAFVLKDGH